LKRLYAEEFMDKVDAQPFGFLHGCDIGRIGAPAIAVEHLNSGFEKVRHFVALSPIPVVCLLHYDLRALPNAEFGPDYDEYSD
jgi:hypothetical protein